MFALFENTSGTIPQQIDTLRFLYPHINSVNHWRKRAKSQKCLHSPACRLEQL